MSEVLTGRDGAVLTITLNRPDVRNAFNAALHARLHEALEAQGAGTDHLDAWSNYHLGLMHAYRFTSDDNAIAIHAFLEMRFSKDAPPGFPLGAFKAGAKIKTRFCGFYKLRGNKICEFRVFPFLGEQLG